MRIKLRADRRGFLNACTAVSVAIAGLLWAFAADHAHIRPEPGVAVLLIAPALLILFVTRPSESSMVSSVLTGVRNALAVSGVSCAVAASALAGVRVTNHERPTLVACAILASVAALTIAIAWLGAFALIRIYGNRLRRFWCGPPDRRRWTFAATFTSSLLLASTGTATAIAQSGVERRPALAGGLAILSATPALFLWWPRREGAAPVGILVTGCVAVAVAAAAAGAFWAGGRTHTAGIAAAVIGAGLAAASFVAAASAELAPLEDRGVARSAATVQAALRPAR